MHLRVTQRGLRGLRARPSMCAGRSRTSSAADAAAGGGGGDAELLSLMKQFAGRSRSSVSMHTLLETGHGRLLDPQDSIKSEAEVVCQHERMLLQVASFLRRELPVRIAHRARELDNMPEGLYQMPSIQVVKNWYMDSFADLVALANQSNPSTLAESEPFNATLRRIKDRHADTNIAIARALVEFREEVLAKKTFTQVMRALSKAFAARNMSHARPSDRRKRRTCRTCMRFTGRSTRSSRHGSGSVCSSVTTTSSRLLGPPALVRTLRWGKLG